MDKNRENTNSNKSPAEKLINLVCSVGKIVLPESSNLTNIPNIIKKKGEANNPALDQYYLVWNAIQKVSKLNPTNTGNTDLVSKCIGRPSLTNITNSVGKNEHTGINTATSQYNLLQKASKLNVVTEDSADLVSNCTNRASLPNIATTYAKKECAGVNRANSLYNLTQKASKLSVLTEANPNLAISCSNRASLTNIAAVCGKKQYTNVIQAMSQYNLLQQTSKLNVISEEI